MTLWEEPQWTDAFALRCRVRSTYTGNVGSVTAVEPGRRLLVNWDAMGGRDSYEAFHSSPSGLVVEP